MADGQACILPIFWENPKWYQGCSIGVAALDGFGASVEGAACFLCYLWCTSFIVSAVFVSAAFGILAVACLSMRSLF